MSELEGWEVRTGRATPSSSRTSSSAWPRRAPASPRSSPRTSTGSAHPRDHGGHEHRDRGGRLEAGDRAVTTTHEHAGGLGPLVAARDRFGVELAFADIGDGSDDEATLAAFDAAITPRTKLVSLSHVLSMTGAACRSERIAGSPRSAARLVAVDGAQAVGAIPVDVRDRRRLLRGRRPEVAARPGGGRCARGRAGAASSASRRAGLSFAGSTPGEVRPTAARRFEGRTTTALRRRVRPLDRLAVDVRRAAVDPGTRPGRSPVGRPDRLAAIPGVTMLTPRDQMATLVTFRIAAWPLGPPSPSSGRASSRSPGRSRPSTPCGSASASSRPTTRSSASRAPSSCSRRTRPRPSRPPR